MDSRPAPPALQVRKPSFGLDDAVPRYWFGGDAFATHYMNALSSVFPDGEAFFVRSVLHYRERIDDPALLRALQGFAGQEAQHSHQHDRHLDLLDAQGYAALGRMNRVMDRVMRWQNRRFPAFSLAMTAAVEHLTALLARRILEHGARFTQSMDARMADLWRWHALEEAEHKAVAYDVLMQVEPAFPRRFVVLILATAGLFVEMVVRTAYMLFRDGVLMRRATWSSGWRFLFARGGLLRGHAPEYFAWFRRDFHPAQIDDTPLVLAWRDRFALPAGR